MGAIVNHVSIKLVAWLAAWYATCNSIQPLLVICVWSGAPHCIACSMGVWWVLPLCYLGFAMGLVASPFVQNL